MLAGILRLPQARPTDIASPALLLDALDANTVTAADGRVSAWADKSGNGRHFAGSSTTKPYQWVKGKSINFRGAEYLTMATPFMAGLTTGCSIFMVARLARVPNSNGAARFYGENSTSTDQTLYELASLTSTPKNLRMFVRRDNGFLPISLSGSNAFGYPYTFAAGQTYPDGASGSTPGKGFTCTGLCHDPADDTWLVGNDGRPDSSATEYNPSIVKVNKAGTAIIGEIAMKATFPDIQSIQGVCIDPTNDSLWFSSFGELKLRNVTRSGASLGSITFAGNPAGIAYDPRYDALWACRTNRLFLYAKDGAMLRQIDITPFTSTADQLFLRGNELWITSDESPGRFYRYDTDTGEASPPYYLPEAGTIEGIYTDGATLWINNDAYFHSGNNPLNQLQKYSVHPSDGFELIGMVENRSSATLYSNGAVIGTPNTTMNPMVANYTPNVVSIGAAVKTTISQYLFGDIKALIVVPGALDQSSRERVEGILGWHCRIAHRFSSSHPYRYRPPRS